jgi:signal transduction histidine kinase
VHTWGFGDGIPGWVLKYKVPYGTSDAINDPLIRSDLAINENVRSIICTPVLDSQGEVIGYFDIRNKIGAEGFSVFDQEMLLMIAPVASIAIQNALAYQRRLETVAELKESSRQLEELAARLESTREEERLRISRELHDQLGQSLTAIKFDLTALTEQLNHIDTELAHKGKDIMTQVNTMIKTVRRITTELRPGMLDDLGLIASIEWQASDFQKRTGIECKVYGSENDLSLSKEQSLVIFRIFQEALTNVARYANAKHVEIRLTTDGEVLNFDFHDDGRGIRPEEISGSQSLGLLGMRERVKHIGGIFRISGTINEGTTINVIIPLSQGK